jgi:hypothetical protein
MEKALGLPPQPGTYAVAEFYVDPKYMFRPAVSPDPIRHPPNWHRPIVVLSSRPIPCKAFRRALANQVRISFAKHTWLNHDGTNLSGIQIPEFLCQAAPDLGVRQNTSWCKRTADVLRSASCLNSQRAAGSRGRGGSAPLPIRTLRFGAIRAPGSKRPRWSAGRPTASICGSLIHSPISWTFWEVNRFLSHTPTDRGG